MRSSINDTRAVAALRAAHDGGIGLVIVLSILSFRSPGKVNYSEGIVLKLQTKCLKQTKPISKVMLKINQVA